MAVRWVQMCKTDDNDVGAVPDGMKRKRRRIWESSGNPECVWGDVSGEQQEEQEQGRRCRIWVPPPSEDNDDSPRRDAQHWKSPRPKEHYAVSLDMMSLFQVLRLMEFSSCGKVEDVGEAQDFQMHFRVVPVVHLRHAMQLDTDAVQDSRDCRIAERSLDMMKDVCTNTKRG